MQQVDTAFTLSSTNPTVPSLIFNESLSEVSPGTFESSFEWTYRDQPGEYLLTATIDPQNVFSETNEQNNTVSTFFAVNDPDRPDLNIVFLGIGRLQIPNDPSSLELVTELPPDEPGLDLTMVLEVRNTGEQPVQGVQVDVTRTDGSSANAFTVLSGATLQPGETRVIESQAALGFNSGQRPPAGFHTYIVDGATSGVPQEKFVQRNNTRQETLLVYASDTDIDRAIYSGLHFLYDFGKPYGIAVSRQDPELLLALGKIAPRYLSASQGGQANPTANDWETALERVFSKTLRISETGSVGVRPRNTGPVALALISLLPLLESSEINCPGNYDCASITGNLAKWLAENVVDDTPSAGSPELSELRGGWGFLRGDPPTTNDTVRALYALLKFKERAHNGEAGIVVTNDEYELGSVILSRQILDLAIVKGAHYVRDAGIDLDSGPTEYFLNTAPNSTSDQPGDAFFAPHSFPVRALGLYIALRADQGLPFSNIFDEYIGAVDAPGEPGGRNYGGVNLGEKAEFFYDNLDSFPYLFGQGNNTVMTALELLHAYQTYQLGGADLTTAIVETTDRIYNQRRTHTFEDGVVSPVWSQPWEANYKGKLPDGDLMARLYNTLEEYSPQGVRTFEDVNLSIQKIVDRIASDPTGNDYLDYRSSYILAELPDQYAQWLAFQHVNAPNATGSYGSLFENRLKEQFELLTGDGYHFTKRAWPYFYFHDAGPITQSTTLVDEDRFYKVLWSIGEIGDRLGDPDILYDFNVSALQGFETIVKHLIAKAQPRAPLAGDACFSPEGYLSFRNDAFSTAAAFMAIDKIYDLGRRNGWQYLDIPELRNLNKGVSIDPLISEPIQWLFESGELKTDGCGCTAIGDAFADCLPLDYGSTWYNATVLRSFIAAYDWFSTPQTPGALSNLRWIYQRMARQLMSEQLPSGAWRGNPEGNTEGIADQTAFAAVALADIIEWYEANLSDIPATGDGPDTRPNWDQLISDSRNSIALARTWLVANKMPNAGGGCDPSVDDPAQWIDCRGWDSVRSSATSVGGVTGVVVWALGRIDGTLPPGLVVEIDPGFGYCIGTELEITVSAFGNPLPTNVALTVEDALATFQPISLTKAGDRQWKGSYTIPNNFGTYSFYAQADNGASVGIPSQSFDEGSVNVTQDCVSDMVVALNVTPELPVCGGETLTAEVQVVNTGDFDFANVTVDLFLGDPESGDNLGLNGAIPLLGAGNTENFFLDFTLPEEFEGGSVTAVIASNDEPAANATNNVSVAEILLASLELGVASVRHKVIAPANELSLRRRGIIDFETTALTDVEFLVLDEGEGLVRSYGDFTVPPGTASLAWDGTDEGNDFVEDGIYILEVTGTCGTNSSSRRDTVEVDNTPPTIVLTSPEAGACITGQLDLIGSVRDFGFTGADHLQSATISYRLSEEEPFLPLRTLSASAGPQSLLSVDTTAWGNGTLELRVEAIDIVNNMSVVTRSFQLNNNPPAPVNIFSPVALGETYESPTGLVFVQAVPMAGDVNVTFFAEHGATGVIQEQKATRAAIIAESGPWYLPLDGEWTIWTVSDDSLCADLQTTAESITVIINSSQIEVLADRESYLPGEIAQIDLTVRDNDLAAAISNAQDVNAIVVLRARSVRTGEILNSLPNGALTTLFDSDIALDEPGDGNITLTGSWLWDSNLAYAGAFAHRSSVRGASHGWTASSSVWTPVPGQTLVQYVWLPAGDYPDAIMLEFEDASGSREHRAYWGDNLFDVGDFGTASRQYMGTLPDAGTWVRLEVRPEDVGLVGMGITGITYSVVDGTAYWDRTALGACCG